MESEMVDTSTHPGFAEPLFKEAWREYVDTPVPVKPVRPKTFKAYKTMTSAAREKLNDARFDYHSALVIVPTPDMKELHSTMRRTLILNRAAQPGPRRGHIVDGAPTLGKSTTVKTFGRDFERTLRKQKPELWNVPGRDYVPVVYVSIQAEATPKGLSKHFANYLGLPLKSKASKDEITDAVLRALIQARTEVVIVDDIHFLDCDKADGQRANNHLKYIQNHVPATFIYAGVNLENSAMFYEGIGEMGKARGMQTAGRFSRLPMQPFGRELLYGDKKSAAAKREAAEWVKVVRTFESALDLFNHPVDSLATKHWEYLLRRTQGRIASLSHLMRAGAIEAILTGVEKVDGNLLDSIDLDWTAEAEYDSIKQEISRKAANKAPSRKRGRGGGTTAA